MPVAMCRTVLNKRIRSEHKGNHPTFNAVSPCSNLYVYGMRWCWGLRKYSVLVFITCCVPVIECCDSVVLCSRLQHLAQGWTVYSSHTLHHGHNGHWL